MTGTNLKGMRKSKSIFLEESAPGGRVGSPWTAGGGPCGSASSAPVTEKSIEFLDTQAGERDGYRPGDNSIL